MAYILTPRFAPAYQAPQCNSFGSCTPSSRPAYGYRTMQRSQSQSQPQFHPSPFASFFSQLDDLIGEINHESQRQAHVEAQIEAQRVAQIEAQRAAQLKARREAYQAHIEAQRAAYRQRQAQIEAYIEAHRQRQLRERALEAKFAVTQSEQGWQVNAEVPGFEQANISIEVTDENTLKIAGDTKWGAKPQVKESSEAEVSKTAELSDVITTAQSASEKIEGNSLESEIETATPTKNTESETESPRPATPDSDTSSHRSYQPTVEDDYEDLSHEVSILFSRQSEPTTPKEPKGKEKVDESAQDARETVDDPEVSVPTEKVAQNEATVQKQQKGQEEQQHASFERTFRFPERIDASKVSASLKEGVLSISVPRMQVQQVRRIAVL